MIWRKWVGWALVVLGIGAAGAAAKISQQSFSSENADFAAKSAAASLLICLGIAYLGWRLVRNVKEREPRRPPTQPLLGQTRAQARKDRPRPVPQSKRAAEESREYRPARSRSKE